MKSISTTLLRIVTNHAITGQKKHSKQSHKPRSHFMSKYFRQWFEKPLTKVFLGIGLSITTLIFNLSIPKSAYSNNNNQPVLSTQVISAPIQLNTTNKYRYPLDNKPFVNQMFRSYHHGIDLKGKTGDAVYPITEGIVEKIVHQKFAYGNHIIIQHPNGLKSLYAHLSAIYVSQGQQVGQYSIIGAVGSTGKSTGPHLHLGISYQNEYLDPYYFVMPQN